MNATVSRPKRPQSRRAIKPRKSAVTDRAASKLDRDQIARIVRADARIRSGFYDDPMVRALTIVRLQAGLR